MGSAAEVCVPLTSVGGVFSNVDLVVTLTTTVPPPTIEEPVRLGIELEMNRNTGPFNIYGPDDLPSVRIHQLRAADRCADQRATFRGGEGAGARARLPASNRLACKAAPHFWCPARHVTLTPRFGF